MLSIFGKIIGDLITARWFPTSTPRFSIGIVHFGLPHAIAIGMIFAVWLFNVFGIRPFKGLTYVTGGLLTIVLIVVMFVPYLTGDWHSSNVHATFTGPWGGWKLIFVWIFILGWSSWAAEVCATFAPEYKTRRDTTRRAAHVGAYTSSACSAWCRSVSAALRGFRRPPLRRGSSTRARSRRSRAKRLGPSS